MALATTIDRAADAARAPARELQKRWTVRAEGGVLLDKFAADASQVQALTLEADLLQRLPAEFFPSVLTRTVHESGLHTRYLIAHPRRLDHALASGAPPSRLAALQLCHSMAAAIAALHERGHADKQLVPARFFVPADTLDGRLCLAELGSLTRPPVEERQAGALAWIEGDLNYLAPEQSGRMNRVIDYRSDLYTLGVIFYRILTGRLPFAGHDELALLHAHLSLPPPAPTSFDADFPLAWERLLLKLLAKNAEDRYQSASGLSADLDWLCRQTQESFAPPLFHPALHEPPQPLAVPEKLYGRLGELQLLLQSFATAVDGGKVLMLVAGYSGSGKSSLINEVHKPITAARGTFIAGKFDPYQRDTPYVAVLAALRELVALMLAEHDGMRLHWRTRLAEALGRDGAVMLALVPELEQLIGAQPPLPEVGPAEAEARQRRVFQAFIRVFTRADHPLVLFLDDLQWADAASLQLLENLFADSQPGHLMVIGAFRDNEIDAGHLLPGCLERIAELGVSPVTVTLGALAIETVRQLLSDTLLRPPGDLAALARTLHEKTAGNPFFLKVLLHSLAERGLLHHDAERRRWTWDDGALDDEAVSGNVVDLLLASMRKLPEGAAEMLSMAAFLGSTFSRADLLDVGHGQELLLQNELALLERLRHITRLRGDGEPRWRFQHDRIREAAYQLCPPVRCAARHVRIGRRLARREPDLARSDRLFKIIEHLNHGLPAKATKAHWPLLHLNLAAGLRARRSLAYASAVHWLDQVHRHLDDALWLVDRPFAFSTSFELASALFLNGQADAAKAVLRALLPRAEGPLEVGAVQDLHVTLLCAQALYAEAIDVGRSALATLGVELPAGDVERACDALQPQVAAMLRTVPPERIVDQPLMSDASMRLALRILKSLVPPSYVTQPALCQLIGRVGLLLSLRHGLAPESSYLFASYGTTSLAQGNDESGGALFGRIGLALAEKFEGLSSVCLVCETLVGHLNHWTRPLAESAELTRRAHDAGIASGETQFVAYTYVYQGFNLFHGGTPLRRLIELTSEYRAFGKACGNHLAKDSLDAVQLLATLLGGDSPLAAATGIADVAQLEAKLLDQWQRRSSTNALIPYRVGRAQIHLLFGELGAAQALMARVREDDFRRRLPGVIGIAVQHFIEALLCARLAPPGEPGRSAAVATIRDHLIDLRRWAAGSPSNFGHCVPAAEAELALLDERPADALKLLRQALDAARAGHMLIDQIILAERAADIGWRHGESAEASAFLLQAEQAAEALQARRKIDELHRRHPLLAHAAERRAPPGEPVLPSRSLQVLEMQRVLEIIVAFNRETHFDALVERIGRTLLELSGASGFALLLPRDAPAGWRLHAHHGLQGLHGNAAMHIVDLPLDEASPLLPVPVVQRALAQPEPLLLNRLEGDAPPGAIWPQAVWCLPLDQAGERIALVYLESALARDVFTPEALRLVEILTAQITTSLFKASMVERLERMVRQRTAEVQLNRNTLDAMLEHSPTLMFVKDLDGRFLRHTPQMATLFGRPGGSLVGLRLEDISPSAPAGRSQEEDRQVATQGKVLRIEQHVCLPDGERIFLTHKFPLRDGEGRVHGIGGIAVDITELKDAQATAESATRAKSAFLATMSHEIRTPMNAILGMAHLALQSGLDARQHNYVTKVERSAQGLLAIINDILDFSKIESGKLELEHAEFELDQVIDDLAALLGLQASKKGLALRFERAPGLPSALVGDPLRLGQVLVNLAANAIKFSERGEVLLRIEALDSDATSALLRFSVRDSGPGIDEAQQQRLFRPFEQADSSVSRRYGGTGLGLAISHRLVAQMGGQLAVTSSPGQGSDFHFNLRLGLRQRPAATAITLRDKHLLIIDDQRRERSALLLAARSLGMTAECVHDGWSAMRLGTLAHDNGRPFDLVLMRCDAIDNDLLDCVQALAANPHLTCPMLLAAEPEHQAAWLSRVRELDGFRGDVIGAPGNATELFEACCKALAMEAPTAHPLQGTRLLLAEDNLINQELMMELLGDAGISVSVVGNGREAVDAVRREPFDAVLMDLQMPVMDGYEATRLIRAEPRFALLPIIAMSAHAMSGDREAAMAAGLSDYITKPIDLDRMFRTLVHWLAPRA